MPEREFFRIAFEHEDGRCTDFEVFQPEEPGKELTGFIAALAFAEEVKGRRKIKSVTRCVSSAERVDLN